MFSPPPSYQSIYNVYIYQQLNDFQYLYSTYFILIASSYVGNSNKKERKNETCSCTRSQKSQILKFKIHMTTRYMYIKKKRFISNVC